MTNTAENIFNNFNVNKFRRDHTQDKKEIVGLIKSSLKKSIPLKFVMYWGKGMRDTCGEPEKQALEYLSSFLDRIETDTELLVIYTDTHVDLNGYPAKGSESYLNSLEEILEEYNFRLDIMSNHVPHDPVLVLEKMEEFSPDPKLKKNLENSSKKRHRNGDYKIGAHKYYVQNLIENKFMEKEFSDYIFLTYNSPALNNLLPKLPKFYMHSLRKGKSEKPWFIM